MPVEQYQSTQPGGGQYTISYGAGWYIIQRDGKVLKHVSSPTEMGVSGNDVSETLTRDTAVADIEYRRGVEA